MMAKSKTSMVIDTKQKKILKSLFFMGIVIGITFIVFF